MTRLVPLKRNVLEQSGLVPDGAVVKTRGSNTLDVLRRGLPQRMKVSDSGSVHHSVCAVPEVVPMANLCQKDGRSRSFPYLQEPPAVIESPQTHTRGASLS